MTHRPDADSLTLDDFLFDVSRAAAALHFPPVLIGHGAGVRVSTQSQVAAGITCVWKANTTAWCGNLHTGITGAEIPRVIPRHGTGAAGASPAGSVCVSDIEPIEPHAMSGPEMGVAITSELFLPQGRRSRGGWLWMMHVPCRWGSSGGDSITGRGSLRHGAGRNWLEILRQSFQLQK